MSYLRRRTVFFFCITFRTLYNWKLINKLFLLSAQMKHRAHIFNIFALMMEKNKTIQNNPKYRSNLMLLINDKGKMRSSTCSDDICIFTFLTPVTYIVKFRFISNQLNVYWPVLFIIGMNHLLSWVCTWLNGSLWKKLTPVEDQNMFFILHLLNVLWSPIWISLFWLDRSWVHLYANEFCRLEVLI